MNTFLPNTIKLARYYKSLGDQAFEQISDDDIRWSAGESSNSIAVIVKHLWGNMRARWTNFLIEDGEKPWRERDTEFEDDISDKNEMISKWNEGWDCFLGTLESLSEDDLSKTIFIRNEGHSVVDAIQRQMAHYPMHVGQIVYAAKIIKGKDWISLSIPKGDSTAYNKEKFDLKKSNKHFTDEL
ncbi:MAG: hypothetical protein ACJA0X_002555 [Cyclobacteriaceae bacterium]|jgi:hypothetical protein